MNRTARLFAAAVLICLADDAAVAACRDSPEPGVDWSGCDKTKVMLYEVYDDESAFEAHQQTPHFKKYLAEAVPLLASRERAVWKRA